ncbi:hypothetical protein F4804DRAFT_333234 [Jackrogersella minutella]|nr:hypothetical protein F4804DRAFT_333234 [Jackrogersella minutella]
MPTYITRETYACCHCLETRHRSFGTDGGVRIETIPIPSWCPSCSYVSILDASSEVGEDDEHAGFTLDRGSTPCTDELVERLQMLLVQEERCASVGVYGVGRS